MCSRLFLWLILWPPPKTGWTAYSWMVVFIFHFLFNPFFSFVMFCCHIQTPKLFARLCKKKKKHHNKPHKHIKRKTNSSQLQMKPQIQLNWFNCFFHCPHDLSMPQPVGTINWLAREAQRPASTGRSSLPKAAPCEVTSQPIGWRHFT